MVTVPIFGFRYSAIGQVVPAGQGVPVGQGPVYSTTTSQPQQTHPPQNVVPSQQQNLPVNMNNGIPPQPQYASPMGPVTNMASSDFSSQNMPGLSVYQQPIPQQQLL